MDVEENVAETLSYVPYIGIWVSLILFLIDKRDSVRWHAAQGLLVGVVEYLLLGVQVFGWLAAIGLGIYLAVKAYQKTPVRLPVLGELADKIAAKKV